MPNIEKALITNVDLSNYVRVIPDEPINANWPVATCPVLHLSAVLSPSAAQPRSTIFRGAGVCFGTPPQLDYTDRKLNEAQQEPILNSNHVQLTGQLAVCAPAGPSPHPNRSTFQGEIRDILSPARTGASPRSRQDATSRCFNMAALIVLEVCRGGWSPALPLEFHELECGRL
jgi:hypothetical protein